MKSTDRIRLLNRFEVTQSTMALSTPTHFNLVRVEGDYFSTKQQRIWIHHIHMYTHLRSWSLPCLFFSSYSSHEVLLCFVRFVRPFGFDHRHRHWGWYGSWGWRRSMSPTMQMAMRWPIMPSTMPSDTNMTWETVMRRGTWERKETRHFIQGSHLLPVASHQLNHSTLYSISSYSYRPCLRASKVPSKFQYLDNLQKIYAISFQLEVLKHRQR